MCLAFMLYPLLFCYCLFPRNLIFTLIKFEDFKYCIIEPQLFQIWQKLQCIKLIFFPESGEKAKNTEKKRENLNCLHSNRVIHATNMLQFSSNCLAFNGTSSADGLFLIQHRRGIFYISRMVPKKFMVVAERFNLVLL